MSNKEKLPKLVDVYRSSNSLGRRQLPFVVDENLTVMLKCCNFSSLQCCKANFTLVICRRVYLILRYQVL
jgi:hypothetical protein